MLENETLVITRDEFMDAVEAGIAYANKHSKRPLTGTQKARLRAVGISAKQADVGSYVRSCGCPLTLAGGVDRALMKRTGDGVVWDAGEEFAAGFDLAIGKLAHEDQGIDVPLIVMKVRVD